MYIGRVHGTGLSVKLGASKENIASLQGKSLRDVRIMGYRLGVKHGASKRECCLAPEQEFALAPEVVPEVGQAGRREVMCMFQWYAHGRG